jgi:hypothetical protein
MLVIQLPFKFPYFFNQDIMIYYAIAFYNSVMQVRLMKHFSRGRGRIDEAEAMQGNPDPGRDKAEAKARQSKNHVHFVIIITEHNYTK